MDISKLLEKAQEAAGRRNYDYAIELYLQACKLSPDDGAARRELRAVENRLAKERSASGLAKVKMTGYLVKAQSLLQFKKYEAAMEAGEEALRVDPGNMSAQMIVGRAANAANFRNAAIAVFEGIREAKAGGNKKILASALRELAYAYQAVGSIQEAMDAWTEVKKYAPEDREAVQMVRDLSASAMTRKIETGAASGKRGSIARTLVKDTDQTQRLERDAQEIRSSEDLRVAIEDAQKDIQARPDDARLYGKLGDLHKRGENYAEAKSNYELAVTRDATNPTWKFKLDDLEIWRMERDITEQSKKLKNSDSNARDIALKQPLSRLLEYKLKSYQEREKQYSRDSKIKFELGSIYFDMAELKHDHTLYDQAIMRFQNTFEDPKFRQESGLRMGIGFARKAQYDLALKRFDLTLGSLQLKDDRWKNLLYAKADTLEKAGKLTEALQVFLQIYEVDVAFKDVSKRVESIQGRGGQLVPAN